MYFAVSTTGYYSTISTEIKMTNYQTVKLKWTVPKSELIKQDDVMAGNQFFVWRNFKKKSLNVWEKKHLVLNLRIQNINILQRI